MGVELDLVDNRSEVKEYDFIDDSYLSVFDIKLFEHQVGSINAILDYKSGVLDIPTSGGKSLISATLTHIIGNDYPTIIIVPTEKLVKQTFEEFEKLEIDSEAGHITKKMSPKVRKEQWARKHMICTWKMLSNNKDKCVDYKAFIYDELQVMGDVMFSLLINQMSHAQYRVGMTGSVPKDKQKTEKIFCRIGHGVVYKVTPKELQDKGIISNVNIKMIPLIHEIDITEGDWPLEEKYLHTHKGRLDVISDYINTLPKTNTMILCHKKFGENLKKILGYDLITGDVLEDERETYYIKFKTETEYNLIATYDTVGIGLSINEIMRLIVIDMGKNDKRIIQGVGRGLRKAEGKESLEMIDLYTKLYKINESTGKLNQYSYSGSKHVNIRKRMYKELQYPFVETGELHVLD